jgi:hypothetical protein
MGYICGQFINETGWCKAADKLCIKVPLPQCAQIQDLVGYVKLAEAKHS